MVGPPFDEHRCTPCGDTSELVCAQFILWCRPPIAPFELLHAPASATCPSGCRLNQNSTQNVRTHSRVTALMTPFIAAASDPHPLIILPFAALLGCIAVMPFI